MALLDNRLSSDSGSASESEVPKISKMKPCQRDGAPHRQCALFTSARLHKHTRLISMTTQPRSKHIERKDLPGQRVKALNELLVVFNEIQDCASWRQPLVRHHVHWGSQFVGDLFRQTS